MFGIMDTHAVGSAVKNELNLILFSTNAMESRLLLLNSTSHACLTVAHDERK